MNRLTIIGNLTKAPETRTTSSGKNVTTFTVAVGRRGKDDADFFRVNAWEKLGENCQKYLDKGKKVAVVGRVSVSTYTANDGTTRANLEVVAEDIEFLSPRNEAAVKPAAKPETEGFIEIDDDENLPF